jgi:hypothetical protein
MLKFLKMMVAEDVTITEEILEVLAEEVLVQDVREALLQEEKVLEEDLDLTETQLLEKVVSGAKEVLRQEEKVLQIEHLDVLKATVIHLDQEDQEETNNYC